MRLVLQRVKSAQVKVGDHITGAINQGWLVLVGVCPDDNDRDIALAVEKTMHLRMFADSEGKFNLSVLDIKGELLVVSQFTLYGDCRKGRRPSFSDAAKPSQAEDLYELYIKQLSAASGLKVATGQFQADMEVTLVNDGPVTMLIDTKKVF